MTIQSKTFLFLAGLLSATPSIAQFVDQEDLERCAAMETSERKLACFESLTMAGMDKQSNESANRGSVVTDEVSRAGQVLPEVVVEKRVNSAAKGDLASRNDTDDELPEASTEELPEQLTATVVDVTRGRFDVLYFHLANGEVWRQTEARRFRYPKEGDFDVTITTGMMGDYRLRVEGSGPMTRIRRVE